MKAIFVKLIKKSDLNKKNFPLTTKENLRVTFKDSFKNLQDF